MGTPHGALPFFRNRNIYIHPHLMQPLYDFLQTAPAGVTYVCQPFQQQGIMPVDAITQNMYLAVFPPGAEFYTGNKIYAGRSGSFFHFRQAFQRIMVRQGQHRNAGRLCHCRQFPWRIHAVRIGTVDM